MANGNAPGGDTVQTIGFQLAMAFGQGAGTMLATSAALLTAFGAYQAAFEEREKANTWREVELRSIEYARALGRTAAAEAAKAGRCVIDSADVEAALTIIQKNRLRPLIDCDITRHKSMTRAGQPGQ